MVKTKVIQFEHEKDTPNKARYKEVPAKGEPEIVGSLYVSKWYAEGAKSVEVTLTIKE
jgi:hypothetical protein